MKNILALSLSFSLFLAACAPPIGNNVVDNAPQTAPSPRDLSSCHGEGLSGWIGQDKEILMRVRMAIPIRVEEPGQAYTMEYQADRLRIIIDEKGKIADLICG